MESDCLAQRTGTFGFYFLEIASEFLIMSFQEKIDIEYAVNIMKLPEWLAIDPKNSKTMQKLKLQLVSKVNSMQT